MDFVITLLMPHILSIHTLMMLVLVHMRLKLHIVDSL